MRTTGSVRFTPYFKIQYFDAVSLAWKDVQRSYATEQAARDAIDFAMMEPLRFEKGWRIMNVTEQGRYPLPVAS